MSSSRLGIDRDGADPGYDQVVIVAQDAFAVSLPFVGAPVSGAPTLPVQGLLRKPMASETFLRR